MRFLFRKLQWTTGARILAVVIVCILINEVQTAFSNGAAGKINELQEECSIDKLCLICYQGGALYNFHHSKIPGVTVKQHLFHTACMQTYSEYFLAGKTVFLCPFCKSPQDSTTPAQKLQIFCSNSTYRLNAQMIHAHVSECKSFQIVNVLETCAKNGFYARFASIAQFMPKDVSPLDAQNILLGNDLTWRSDESGNLPSEKRMQMACALFQHFPPLLLEMASDIINSNRTYRFKKNNLKNILQYHPTYQIFQSSSVSIKTLIHGLLKRFENGPATAQDLQTCFNEENSLKLVLFALNSIKDHNLLKENLAKFFLFYRERHQEDLFCAFMTEHLGVDIFAELLDSFLQKYQTFCPDSVKNPAKVARCNTIRQDIGCIFKRLPTELRNTTFFKCPSKGALYQSLSVLEAALSKAELLQKKKKVN